MATPEAHPISNHRNRQARSQQIARRRTLQKTSADQPTRDDGKKSRRDEPPAREREDGTRQGKVIPFPVKRESNQEPNRGNK